MSEADFAREAQVLLGVNKGSTGRGHQGCPGNPGNLVARKGVLTTIHALAQSFLQVRQQIIHVFQANRQAHQSRIHRQRRLRRGGVRHRRRDLN
jgi:hypothetical protein